MSVRWKQFMIGSGHGEMLGDVWRIIGSRGRRLMFWLHGLFIKLYYLSRIPYWIPLLFAKQPINTLRPWSLHFSVEVCPDLLVRGCGTRPDRNKDLEGRRGENGIKPAPF